ncbi:MAG: hypothetical protein IPN76_35170 [Saprospiraceae bacterium]|nr:hypothetical protein [Saprospiraceae bacterium]
MKIEIQNLGPIHHFEFDLEKDLHLLYGENNVGKSFAVNVVYCVLKNLSNLSMKEKSRRFLKSSYDLKELDKAMYGKIIEGIETKVDIKAEVLSQGKIIIDKIILPAINDSLINTFQSLSNLSGRIEEKTWVVLKSNTIEIQIRIDFSGFIAIEKIAYKGEIKIKLQKKGNFDIGFFGKGMQGLYFLRNLEIFFDGDNLLLPPSYFLTVQLVFILSNMNLTS